MRPVEIERRTNGHDAGRVDGLVAPVIVFLDVSQVHRVGNTRGLIEITQIGRQVAVVVDTADIAFEVADINGIETYERRKEPPVGFGLAIAEKVTALAKALIEAGAKIDVASGPEKLTALMVCATQLQPQQRLNQLAHGPTPLALAEELIKRGANVNSQSKDGVSALMIAAGQNNAPMIGLLLRAGADPKMTSKAGKTALDIATEAGNEAASGALKFLTSATPRPAVSGPKSTQ